MSDWCGAILENEVQRRKRSMTQRLLTFLLILEYHLFIEGENIMRTDRELL